MASLLDLAPAIAEPLRVNERAREEAVADVPLVHAAREGRPQAFSELYRRWQRTVHGVLLASVPRQDVDDMVQDAFLHAYRSLHTLRDASAFGGWPFHRPNLATDYTADRPDGGVRRGRTRLARREASRGPRRHPVPSARVRETPAPARRGHDRPRDRRGLP